MEKHQIQPQNFEKNDYILPGIWDKSWVRPYESLWSILNTYKTVNVIRNHTTLMKAIGTNINATVVDEYFISYGIFCNLSSKKNDINRIISRLVPEWYIKQIEVFTTKKEISYFFSEAISYCPKCMKNGYHSILHQLKGIQNCPFHPNISMIPYLGQSYIFGTQSPFRGDHRDLARLQIFTRDIIIKKRIDFEDPSSLPLPINREDMPEITKFFENDGFRKNYDYIKPIGADIYTRSISSEIGSFLLNQDLKPEFVIENIEEADASIIEKLNKRAINCGLKYCYIKCKHLFAFKYQHMQIFVAEKLLPYSPDEIDYKCYRIERGKFIPADDELGVLLLYMLFLTGDERIEESLSIIRETSDAARKYSPEYRYYTSELCIHDLDISNLYISAQYYILEDYINTNFEKFKTYVNQKGGMEKPLFRRNINFRPIHMIYVEEDNLIKIYRY